MHSCTDLIVSLENLIPVQLHDGNNKGLSSPHSARQAYIKIEETAKSCLLSLFVALVSFLQFIAIFGKSVSLTHVFLCFFSFSLFCFLWHPRYVCMFLFGF